MGGLAFAGLSDRGSQSLTVYSLSGTKEGRKQDKPGSSETCGGLRTHIHVSLAYAIPNDHNPPGPKRNHSDSWLRSQVLSETCITDPRTRAQNNLAHGFPPNHEPNTNNARPHQGTHCGSTHSHPGACYLISPLASWGLELLPWDFHFHIGHLGELLLGRLL